MIKQTNNPLLDSPLSSKHVDIKKHITPFFINEKVRSRVNTTFVYYHMLWIGQTNKQSFTGQSTVQ